MRKYRNLAWSMQSSIRCINHCTRFFQMQTYTVSWKVFKNTKIFQKTPFEDIKQAKIAVDKITRPKVHEDKYGVRYVESTHFEQTFAMHLPHTELRQVFHKSFVLLRHFEILYVFRFFLWFVRISLCGCDFPLPEFLLRFVPVSSPTARCLNTGGSCWTCNPLKRNNC